MSERFNICLFGLSITSSWGNGHATTYRALVRELCGRGHDVLFFERDVPWYAANRDLPNPPYGRTVLYSSLEEVRDRFSNAVREADLTIVGSYVPEGIALGEWVNEIAGGVTAFYDIDTPVTLAGLESGVSDYLSYELMTCYDIYLSFTGGPTLRQIEGELGSPMARPLYCSVDSSLYYPQEAKIRWDLGYMGTYSRDRQPALNLLVIEPARQLQQSRMVVAGPQYPPEIDWPPNIERFEHLSPVEHCRFYNSQRFTLNLTRAEMITAGYSPSVRLFEASACAAPIISDYWIGLDSFFRVGQEILVARSSEDVVRIVSKIPEEERIKIGERARARVLAEHTAAHRAAELEGFAMEVLNSRAHARG
jgi:spore maturation protein CgeB